MALVTGVMAVLAVIGVIYSRQITSLLSSPEETPQTPRETAKPERERWIQLPIVPERSGAAGERASGPGAAEPKPHGTTPDSFETQQTPAELKDVKDGTPIERDAFYWLLGRADKEFGRSDLALVRAPDTSVNDLYERSAEYRGKPVTLTGIVRSLRQRELAENPAGLKASTEADLDVLDKRVWVVAPRVGLDWKVGNRVRVTGYFFKIRLYADTEGRQVQEPVVVVTNVERLGKAPPTAGTPLPTSPGVPSVETMGEIFAGLLAAYFALMFYTRHRQKAHFEQLEAMRRNRRRTNEERDGGDEEEMQPPPPADS
jgi:hypothetical protein